MADLGTLPVYTHTPPVPRVAVTDYDIHRGLALGALLVKSGSHRPAYVKPLTEYVVRQLRVIYRQLWPDHGQRFPQ